MIYELKDTTKARALFDGMEDSMIRSCLEGVMGSIYVTDEEAPRSALAFLACFAFYAGEPDRELAAFKPKGVVGMVPPDESWAALIETLWPDAEKVTRYAIKKETRFDRRKLEAIRASLPVGYELRKIDGEIYDLCLKDEQFMDNVGHFASKEQFLSMGRGFAVMKDGKLVSAASSYTVYREGIEIEIDTAEAERRKGLAGAAGAALILSCLDDGLYPSWDAANPISVHLAEKLGYEFSHEYACYWLAEILDRAIPDPDRSDWDALCGSYRSDEGRRFEVLRKNGDLFFRFESLDGARQERKLFPLGERRFGLAWYDGDFVFSEGCLRIDGTICKRQ